MLPYPFFHLSFLDITPPFWSSQYWASVVQNAIGCTIGSFAAIAAAYLIYWLTNKDSRKGKAQEAKDLLVYFKGTVANVIKTARNQTANLQAYCSSIQKNDLQLPLLLFLPMYNLKKIAEGDSMDRILIAYIRAFPGQDDANNFTSLIANIEYLYSQFLQFPEETHRYMTFENERKSELKIILKNALASIGEYVLRADVTDPPHFFNELQPIIQAFNEQYPDNSNPSIFNQYFFIPLNDLLTVELVTSDPDPAIIPLRQLIHEGMSLFDEIKAQNQRARTNVLEIIPSLNIAIQSLEHHASKLLTFT